jgi:hypothetical protein
LYQGGSDPRQEAMLLGGYALAWSLPVAAVGIETLAPWYYLGAETDAVWAKLPLLPDKVYWEIGLKTLGPDKWKIYGEPLAEIYGESAPFYRGLALVEDLGWFRAILPELTPAYGQTLGTGASALTRYLFPKFVLGAGGLALGAGTYFLYHSDSLAPRVRPPSPPRSP